MSKNRKTKLIMPKLPKTELQDLVTTCKQGQKNLAMYVKRDQTVYCAISFKAPCVYQQANYDEGAELYICKKYNQIIQEMIKKYSKNKKRKERSYEV